MVLMLLFFREHFLFTVLLFPQNEALYFYSKKAHGRKIPKKSRSSWGKSFFLHPIESDQYEGLPEMHMPGRPSCFHDTENMNNLKD